MNQSTYNILSHIPIFGAYFRRKHQPMITSMMFGDDGVCTWDEFNDCVREYSERHPDEAITAELVDRILGNLERRHTQDDQSKRC